MARLLNFHADDREQLLPDGSLRRLHWSTPLSDFREFQGRRLPTRGETIWHQADGEFVYGRFELRSIQFDELALY